MNPQMGRFTHSIVEAKRSALQFDRNPRACNS